MEAGGLQKHYDKFKDQGFEVITLLIEAADKTPATSETVAKWNKNLGLSYVVVAAPGNQAARYFLSGGCGLALPSLKTLKPGVVVEEALLHNVSEGQIQSILP